jgi:hypothetical protein
LTSGINAQLVDIISIKRSILINDILKAILVSPNKEALTISSVDAKRQIVSTSLYGNEISICFRCILRAMFLPKESRLRIIAILRMLVIKVGVELPSVSISLTKLKAESRGGIDSIELELVALHAYIIVVFCSNLGILQAANVKAKAITDLVLVSDSFHFMNGPARQLSIKKLFIIMSGGASVCSLNIKMCIIKRQAKLKTLIDIIFSELSLIERARANVPDNRMDAIMFQVVHAFIIILFCSGD